MHERFDRFCCVKDSLAQRVALVRSDSRCVRHLSLAAGYELVTDVCRVSGPYRYLQW